MATTDPRTATQGQWEDLVDKVKAKQDPLTAGTGIDSTQLASDTVEVDDTVVLHEDSLTPPISTAFVNTVNIIDKAVTSNKIDWGSLGWMVLSSNTPTTQIGASASLVFTAVAASSAAGNTLASLDGQRLKVNYTGTIILSGSVYMTCTNQSYAGIARWTNISSWSFLHRNYTASGNQTIQCPMVITRCNAGEMFNIVGGSSGQFTIGSTDAMNNRLFAIFLPD